MVTQRCLGKRNKRFAVNIVAAAFKNSGGFNFNKNIEIARWAAAHAGVTRTANPQPGAGFYSRRDLNFNFSNFSFPPAAMTAGAGAGDYLALAAAIWTGDYLLKNTQDSALRLTYLSCALTGAAS